MNKEDYNKFYIQGSNHYLIPKYVFDELFNEMSNWKEESQKQKEVINKAIDLLNAYIGVLDDTSDLYFENVKSILELEVKEVSK